MNGHAADHGSGSGHAPAGEGPGASLRPRMTPMRMAVQILLFAACLALLGWCMAKVFGPGNRANLERLLQASAGQIAALLALSVVVVCASGGAFRQALKPVRRLPMGEVQAVNFIASALALLPFKLGLVFRILVHNRRHGVPLLTIGAWFGAVTATMGAVLGPVILVSLWRPVGGAVWLGACVAGVGLCVAILIGTARVFRDGKGWAFVEGVWKRLPMPGALRRSAVLERVHEGVRMLSSPQAVLGAVGFRVLDLGMQSARFLVAGAIIGHEFPPAQAVIAGSTYFVIGAVAPAGQLGAREGGTAWILEKLFPAYELNQVMTAVVAISAAEMIVLAIGSVVSLLVLRPDRLLRRTG